MRLYDHQKQSAASKARFIIDRWGRRSGKTVLKRERMIFKGSSSLVKLSREFKHRSVIFIAPTQKQARTIVWEAFKQRLGKIGTYNESRLEIQMPNELGGQTTIFVGGWENRENYRGMSNVVHIEFDELDTMKDFFIGWQEIFRPMLMESGGSAGFGGTPKKENPNLRRLEKEAEEDPEWEAFHFTSKDNPDIDPKEIEKARDEMDLNSYKQEILAEHIDDVGALFHYNAVLDVFTNTVDKTDQKYLIIDVADDGTDKTKFSFWQGLEEYRRETFERLNTEGIVKQAREFQTEERIPMSNTLVDGASVGAGVASNSLLDGIVVYKGSYAAIKTDRDPVRLPNVHYNTKVAKQALRLVSDYKNLRCQCVFTLAELVNNHQVASKVTGRDKQSIIDELPLYQDESEGDGKRKATTKEDIKELLGRSPDDSDTWIMRMYFVVKESILPKQTEAYSRMVEEQNQMFATRGQVQGSHDTR